MTERAVKIGPARTAGDLVLPPKPSGLIIFAHGSGSSRHSPRNRFVAGSLQNANFATLLLDLLTSEEEEIDLHTRQFRFDIDLLAERLIEATQWSRAEPELDSLRVGYFGASTGAAAALIAAAYLPDVIGAVVSRGGRSDLAGVWLPRVQAPTLLIVGGHDVPVIRLNQQALTGLRCEKKLELVPGATHLFEEPGALERVAELSTRWFVQHLQNE